ncbi:MAG: GNAT family N-acetyltransferase [Prolixibacteraceae bacterium]|nr:GNAT family N-acetyltransferase [Prolixibacteraceae bacterium]
MKLQIKKVSDKELARLQKIGVETFAETFSSENSEENMQEYLKSEFSAEKLKADLADKNVEFYFAELDGKVTGYLKINFGPSQTEIKNENSLEIERIYVLEEFHGKKAGQFLFEKAMETAKEKKVDYVWLGVWEHNPRAIRFYEKNGFVAFDKHIFKLGKDRQTDIMMKRMVKNGSR